MNSHTVRSLAYLTGLIIKSFGISLVIRSRLGTGAWDGFYVGMAGHFGLTVGSWLIILGIFLIFFNSFLIKSKPNFFPIITIFILGCCIDFWLHFLNFEPDGAESQVLIFWVGLLFTAVGISIYVQGQFALTPVDQLMYALSKRFGFSLMISKTIGECFALAFAFLLHGPIGLGTIIFTFLCGPLIQFLIPRIERMLFCR
ncbi:YczE/YyaS/YitT family protein [Lihuaxuella thermophila]|uniref:Membrane protein YczE n=1 Tax=Lihuaxuella thermophila TaxID=1173111 RepID=A0A1H8E1R9_9BACL|nr:hypothetical protein [Lihuaxuella thermophila]SEN13541.1 hypothetical protein SAMN05444955_10693 [Lihuaxuella thermophila]